MLTGIDVTVHFLVLVEILQTAVESVLADESFKLPSPLAANALLAALLSMNVLMNNHNCIPC